MSFTYFTKLPQEIQQEVMRQSDKADLLNLNRASLITHDLSLPLLFHTVDISVHNFKGRVPQPVPPDVEADHPHRLPAKLDLALFPRQQCFIRTLVEQPQRGACVKSFTWTIMTVPESESKTGSGYVDHWRDEVVWRAFQTLTSLRSVDVCFLAHEREIDIPPPLFCSASSVRLVGVASYRLATAVLHSVNPSKLTSLALDNLQDLGQTNDGEDVIPGSELSKFPETFNPDGTFRCRHPGPMRGHLLKLCGRFTALKHLELRSVGQDDVNDHLWSANKWSANKDEKRYHEWAIFLRSVKPSLESFKFEQGLEPEVDEPVMNGHPYPRLFQKVRPMDSRFIKFILPVIVEDHWPCLKRISIRGVGGKTRRVAERYTDREDTGLIDTVRDQMMIALGSQVQFTFEEEATRTFGLNMKFYWYDD
ncbi:hypothetical protein MMC16_002559 [Acarospora aff. strigata]|nr:hypothetical protein [Acarospora aff. strigata]